MPLHCDLAMEILLVKGSLMMAPSRAVVHVWDCPPAQGGKSSELTYWEAVENSFNSMYTMYCGERFWILLGQYILYPWREWFNKAQKHVGFPMPSIEQLCEISSLLNMWFWGASLNIYMLMNVNHLEANCGCPCGFKMLYVFKKKKEVAINVFYMF